MSRAPRGGAATASCPTKWSSGRAAKAASTTACSTAVSRTAAGFESGWRPDRSPVEWRRLVTPVFRRALAFRFLALVVATILAVACAEAMFRWHVRRTFDDEFPPWTENLVALRTPQVFEFKPNASGVFPGNVDMTRTFPY